MLSIRKYSYLILFAVLVLLVGSLWAFGGSKGENSLGDADPWVSRAADLDALKALQSPEESGQETGALPREADPPGNEGDSGSPAHPLQPGKAADASDSHPTKNQTDPPQEEAMTMDEKDFLAEQEDHAPQTGRYAHSENKSRQTAQSLQGELRGIWIPFMSLTTPEKTEAAFCANFREIADRSKAAGMNALFVHVRPYGDALYPSSYFPWSHILTGVQGEDPGFDPLRFMLDYSHGLGMDFHAWINPLRVKSLESPDSLSADNPYNALKDDNPYYFLTDDSGIYLNPAHQYIRGLIAKGAAEIAQNYDVDGIHFDDYFYPSEAPGPDADSYEAYCAQTPQPLPLSDWRSANISAMVAEVYQAVKQVNPALPFGISPGGNLDNNQKIGADVLSWCKVPGYVDYICPQLYYSYDNKALGYQDALEAWLALPRHKELSLYIGLGLYKAGSDADEGTWLTDDNLLARQLADARQGQTQGFILYSYDFLGIPETEKELAQFLLEMENPGADGNTP